MPEPTIGERVQELREALNTGSYVRLGLAAIDHMPAILDALERQRNTLLTIEAKSKNEQGALMYSINRLAREALNEHQ